ncbi:MAG: hypothetical protein AVDCRST_MAG13-887, partial [uncultured Solirubrobacteraceae bacterium]
APPSGGPTSAPRPPRPPTATPPCRSCCAPSRPPGRPVAATAGRCASACSACARRRPPWARSGSPARGIPPRGTWRCWPSASAGSSLRAHRPRPL